MQRAERAARYSPPARNADAGDLLETFLIAGVTSLLGIRFYLQATGYPQIGGNGLHIAHLLWGGLLMLVALVGLLAFLGKRVQHTLAVVGGLGFGAFIDELGKFITSDNNYFFRPSIALIYVVFILLFFAFRAISRRRGMTRREYLANAIDLVREAALRPLGAEQQERALRFLAVSDPADPMVAELTAIVRRQEPVAARRSGWARSADRLQGIYLRLVRLPAFSTGLVVLFIGYAVVMIASLVGLIVVDPDFRPGNPDVSFVDWGNVLSSTLAVVLVIIGIVRLPRSRADAYNWFKRATLAAIFLTQIFAFYTEQLVAVLGLGRDLLLLVTLNFLIHEDERTTAAAESPPGVPALSQPGGAA